MSSDRLIKTITKCAEAIQSTAVGCYLHTQDESLKSQMDAIEEEAKEICRAARTLEDQLEAAQ